NVDQLTRRGSENRKCFFHVRTDKRSRSLLFVLSPVHAGIPPLVSNVVFAFRVQVFRFVLRVNQRRNGPDKVLTARRNKKPWPVFRVHSQPLPALVPTAYPVLIGRNPQNSVVLARLGDARACVTSRSPDLPIGYSDEVVFSSLTLDLNNFSSYLVCRLTATDVRLTAPPVKLPVAIKRSRRSHSVPADAVGLRKTPVHSTEPGPVLRRVKVFVKHMHRGVPCIEELARKHIPISVQ